MAENKIYTVATAHLDTIWRWELNKTIEEYLPDTIEKNLDLIKKYPSYKFNFEGAYRYQLIKEYYPNAFEEIKEQIKNGRWCVSGSSYENGDVNIPSPEALFRNILYGNNYFKEEFGVTSSDIFLPDCFGFGYTLPSIAKHSNLKGFSSQKLSWGGAYLRPFDIGIWQGVDGSKIFASLNPQSYNHKFTEDVRGDVGVINNLAENAVTNKLPWTMNYYGTGDIGGAPDENSAKAVNASVYDNKTNENTKVISASSDEIFEDLSKLPNDIINQIPVWDNELVMTNHGVGCYTSRCLSKRLNAQNEIMADNCERSSVLASLISSYKYPKNNIDKAWKRVIAHQFHDDITGTSTMLGYNNSWNDYFVSLKEFTAEYESSVGAIANKIDTSWVSECCVIVNNPVATNRTESVCAHIKLNKNAKFVKVLDKLGNEMPSQVVKKQGKEFDIVFIANVPSVGFKAFDVVGCDTKCKIDTDLKITQHTLENSKFSIMFNKNGDIGSIVDKTLKVQLLSSPIKFELLHDIGSLTYPSWELKKEDVDSKPYCFANTPTFEILENGPARIALKVSREAEYSTIEQVISLDSNGEFVRVENFIDWQERRTLLKASFPFTCSNDNASYDLGLGVISRPTNTDNLFEVPAQKWADLTDEYSRYGVSVFSDCKYGWDKPSENTLRLTCIHTPTGAFTKEARQDLQDIGRNYFAYGIYSHKGKYNNNTQIQSQCFNQKLIAFQTTAKHESDYTDAVSLLNISTNNVLIRAIKQSEDGQNIVIRVNEANGNYQKQVSIGMINEIIVGKEIYASEDIIDNAIVKDGKLVFDLKPFEVKSFAVKLNNTKNKAKENYKKIDLEYNSCGITSDDYKVNCILQGTGCSLPNELIDPSLTINGITFKMPNSEMSKNVYIPREQDIEIPKGTTKIYFIAASTKGGRDVAFFADNKQRNVTIQPMNEYVGTWDMFGLNQTAEIKDGKIALEFTHTHHPEGNKANEKAYFYLYEIDVRNCKTLTMPEDNKVVILAMTAIKRFSSTNIATQIMDNPNKDYKFGEIPPIDKIIDKAEFVSIRAGKVENQVKKGKGKGILRDNIVTNIIRSYTKSNW